MFDENGNRAEHADDTGRNELFGATAVVTGSSGGIGRAIAQELARAGAAVLVHARQNRAAADATAQSIADLSRESRVILCDLADIPVEDARFDHVLLTQVLEHLPEPATVLGELHRVLRPGGTLWLTAPLVSMVMVSLS